MPVSSRNRHIVLTKSGNRCAFPDCNQILVVEHCESGNCSFVAQIAHIKGEKPGSARYDPNMKTDRNNPGNLLVLCPTHHTLIDASPNEYSVEKLNDMKLSHEKWISIQTSKAIVNIGFAELKVVTKYLISNSSTLSSIEMTPITIKIQKNNLSPTTENLIKMGMARVNLVKEYIDKSVDPDFGEKLKQGFMDQYQKLTTQEGLRGDAIFDSLMEFACGNSPDFKQRAAGLTVLSYYFEKCDIFER